MKADLKIINFMEKENKLQISMDIHIKDIIKMELKLMEKWNGYKMEITIIFMKVNLIKMDNFMEKVSLFIIYLIYRQSNRPIRQILRYIYKWNEKWTRNLLL